MLTTARTSLEVTIPEFNPVKGTERGSPASRSTKASTLSLISSDVEFGLAKAHPSGPAFAHAVTKPAQTCTILRLADELGKERRGGTLFESVMLLWPCA